MRKSSRDRNHVVGASVAAMCAVVGLAAALGVAHAQGIQSNHESLVMLGPMIGDQVVAVLSAVGALALLAAGVLTLKLAGRIARGRGPKAWTVAAGVVAFIVAVPLILQFVHAQIVGTEYTYVGETREGIHLYVAETSWFHSIVTVYRQNGSRLDYVYGFATRPVAPFAAGNYELIDNLNSATLVWHWTEDTGRDLSDSVTIPLS